MRPLAFAVPALLLAVSACASGPEERVARAQFACEDGRRLRVAFNLDKGVAEVRVDKSKTLPVLLPRQPDAAGRNYASEGFSLIGVGDQITYATPETPATRCTETR